MSRPRSSVDYGQVRRLHAEGLGTRSIARKLRVSRSLIYRILCGDRPESGPPPQSARSHAGNRRGRWSESERAHAHTLLKIARGSASDEEFAAAERQLDRLLDSRSDSSPAGFFYEVKRALEAKVDARVDAAERAEEERERIETEALDDFRKRWDDEARIATRGIDKVELSERFTIREAIEDEKRRGLTLLARRLKSLATGAVIEDLVDELVAEGLKRIDHLIEKLR